MIYQCGHNKFYIQDDIYDETGFDRQVNKERMTELLVRCFFAANEKELGQDIHFLLYPPEYPQRHYNIMVDGRWLHREGSSLVEMMYHFHEHVVAAIEQYDWERRVSLAVQRSEEYPTPSRRHFLEAVCRYPELLDELVESNKEHVRRDEPGYQAYRRKLDALLLRVDEVIDAIDDYTDLFCPDFEPGEGLIVPVLRPVEVCYV